MLNSREAINNQKYEEPKAHVYNPTLEKLRIQVNSVGFQFDPLELTEIPLRMAEDVGKAVSYKGLFVVWPNQRIEDLGGVKLQALKNFKDFNSERLTTEQAYLDERKKGGVSIDMSTQFNYNKWAKWDKELAILLKENNFIEPVRSFLDVDKEEEIIEPPKRRGKTPVEATV